MPASPHPPVLPPPSPQRRLHEPDASSGGVLQEGDEGRTVARDFEGFTHVLLNLKDLERFGATYAYREHFAGQSDEAFFAWLGSLEPVARWGSIILSEIPAAPND